MAAKKKLGNTFQIQAQNVPAGGGTIDPWAGIDAGPTADSSWGDAVGQALSQQTATYDDGSGYDGGGGGGGVTYAEAPAPTRTLADSPEWLAFLNQLGLNEAQFRGDINKQRGMATTARDMQIGDLAFQGQQQRRQIAGGLETRGMARSGQFTRSLAEQRAGQGRREGAIQTSLANTLGGLESTLAQKLLDLGTQRAQQELQLRANGYV